MKTIKFVFGSALALVSACLFLACGPLKASPEDDDIDDEEEYVPPEDGGSIVQGRDPIETDWDGLASLGGHAITVDPDTVYQTMKGFGASDCWSGNFVGQWNDEAKKQQIADWLFSQEFANGQPKGIGLSKWRVNLGAGSWEQSQEEGGNAAQNPRIGTHLSGNTEQWPTNYTKMEVSWERRAESFLNNVWAPKGADGKISYNWNKQKGQQYFMAEAKKRGTETFVLFSNAPPIPFTRFGYANAGNANATMDSSGKYSADRNTLLKDTAAYTDFANYLADVAEHFQQQGYNISHISPVNEPQWQWNENKQEGSPWTNAQIKDAVVALNTAIQARPAIAGKTKILITEAAQWDFLTGGEANNVRDQIRTFFSPSSSNYVGNLPAMQPWEIAGHTYFTHSNDASTKTVREAVASTAASVGNVAQNNSKPIMVHSTEWCALGGGGGFTNPDDFFDVGLFMAKLAYIDITVANAVTFDFWTALDMELGGNSRYCLIGYTPGSATYTPNSYKTNPVTSPGALKTQPTLWALGNYSLFVRPGFQRIKIETSPALPDDYMNVMASAYKSPAGYEDKNTGEKLNRIVVVYVNMSTSAKRTVAAKFKGDKLPVNIRFYETVRENTSDATTNRNGLRRVRPLDGDEGSMYTIKPRSILTAVYDFPIE